MGFVPFDKLNARQVRQVLRLRRKWSFDEARRFEFWVKPDGNISRRAGHHQLTAEEGAKIDAMLKGEDIRSRTATEGWKPGTTFHTARG